MAALACARHRGRDRWLVIARAQGLVGEDLSAWLTSSSQPRGVRLDITRQEYRAVGRYCRDTSCCGDSPSQPDRGARVATSLKWKGPASLRIVALWAKHTGAPYKRLASYAAQREDVLLILELQWTQALDGRRGRDDLRRGYFLRGGSSCTRRFGWAPLISSRVVDS